MINISQKNRIFSILYYITCTFLLLDVVDSFPLGELFRKIKYIYMIAMFFYFLFDLRIRKDQIKPIGLLSLLAGHAILFGFVFTNPTVYAYTMLHVRECLVFYALVFLTYYYVSTQKCFLLFIALSFFSLATLILFASITHFNHFVNPIYYIKAFGESRYRENFGFVQYGYVGNYCYSTIVLSLFVLKDYLEKGRLPGICIVLFIDFLALCMDFSAASRSSILAIFLTIFFYVYLEFFIKRGAKRYRLLKKIFFLGILSVLVLYILTRATRDLNIEGNYPVFKQLGNFWTGMGYVENHGFQKESSVFGITTTSLDISYVYYYFTTGFIGCLLYAGFTLGSLYEICKCKGNKHRNLVLAIFLAMLFYANWQVNLFTYTYYSNLFFMVMYFVLMSNGNRVWKEDSI